MTKTQGNIIIVLLLAAILPLMFLQYNVFNGFAVMDYKIEKTQALIETVLPAADPVSAKIILCQTV